MSAQRLRNAVLLYQDMRENLRMAEGRIDVDDEFVEELRQDVTRARAELESAQLMYELDRYGQEDE